MSYVKLVGTVNRHTDWTTEIVLEKDEDGNPTKVVRAGEPVDLSADERKQLEQQGYKFEDSKKSEAEEVEATASGAPDVAGSGPLFGDSEAPDQNITPPEQARGRNK